MILAGKQAFDANNFASAGYFTDSEKLTENVTWWNDAHLTACIEGAIETKLGGYHELGTEKAKYLLKQTIFI